MHIGVALPQYDWSIAGDNPLSIASVLDYAAAAATLGADSVWLSDHLFLDLARYGGSPEPAACLDPIVTLAAVARRVPEVRIGTLVLCEAFRPASVLAKSLATLDRLSNGRLDIGLGAGWYEPDYEALGMPLPAPRERLARLADAVEVVKGLLGGGPFTYDGEHHRAVDAINHPPAVQAHPRVFVGGKGDRVLRLAARHADGWNTCWIWTPADYRARLEVLVRECDAVGRDPATVWRTLGLYALCGDDEADLARRFERLQAASPPGVIAGNLDEFRRGRLVGTVDEVREQLEQWRDLGIDTLVVSMGAVPFQMGAVDDLEPMLRAASGN
ncbi:MAG TPA: LLM class flavin-dependent oxidoreductase [Acidimicrobiia bacterium]|nr:LLM class flavin-dependent oxidoreductase [Acidimicrobiia bacterium]